MARKKLQGKKYFLSPRETHEGYSRLSAQIVNEYQPDMIIWLLRGGSEFGNTLTELYREAGLEVPFDAIPMKGYDGENQALETRSVDRRRLRKIARWKRNILVIDDICDEGKSAKAVLSNLAIGWFGRLLGIRREIKYATLCFKPKQEEVVPDWHFYDVEPDTWIAFGHETQGHSVDELVAAHGDYMRDVMTVRGKYS